jgi:L-alanine-DL-glutamate epimerase-like enolase superfamily enzyme
MDVPFFDALRMGGDETLIQNGHITVTDKPGFGVELNEEVARQYAKPGESVF